MYVKGSSYEIPKCKELGQIIILFLWTGKETLQGNQQIGIIIF